MGSVHVCAAIPNFIALEWHWMPHWDLWQNWVQEGNILKDGFIAVTDAPGLGVTMNEETARKRQVPGTPWFEPWRAK
jgi:L-alanine-DL-glutamate epimerase-like enolase superfamily enzyme